MNESRFVAALINECVEALENANACAIVKDAHEWQEWADGKEDLSYYLKKAIVDFVDDVVRKSDITLEGGEHNA